MKKFSDLLIPSAKIAIACIFAVFKRSWLAKSFPSTYWYHQHLLEDAFIHPERWIAKVGHQLFISAKIVYNSIYSMANLEHLVQTVSDCMKPEGIKTDLNLFRTFCSYLGSKKWKAILWDLFFHLWAGLESDLRFIYELICDGNHISDDSFLRICPFFVMQQMDPVQKGTILLQFFRAEILS